jgi:aryl-alcohol dehydrogenase-like predicted oxidoreductase
MDAEREPLVWGTRTHAVMPRHVAVMMGRRLRTLERLAEQSRRTIDQQRALLNSALHELARERGENPSTYALRWIRDHRGFED